jgi:hypothetical protein
MKAAATLAAVFVTGILTMPVIASPNEDSVVHDGVNHSVDDVIVEFGHPGTLSGPGNHVMDPLEVAIVKGGTVTFRTNGLGHGIVIYPVSKSTTREDIADDLCRDRPANCDPAIPAAQCARQILDAEGRLVIVVDAGTTAVPIDYEPGQVLSAGAGRFLTGTQEIVTPAGTTRVPGTLVRVRFNKHGRYLVVCMNRAHAVNECMFGFVDVTSPD